MKNVIIFRNVKCFEILCDYVKWFTWYTFILHLIGAHSILC